MRNSTPQFNSQSNLFTINEQEPKHKALPCHKTINHQTSSESDFEDNNPIGNKFTVEEEIPNNKQNTQTKISTPTYSKVVESGFVSPNVGLAINSNSQDQSGFLPNGSNVNLISPIHPYNQVQQPLQVTNNFQPTNFNLQQTNFNLQQLANQNLNQRFLTVPTQPNNCQNQLNLTIDNISPCLSNSNSRSNSPIQNKNGFHTINNMNTTNSHNFMNVNFNNLGSNSQIFNNSFPLSKQQQTQRQNSITSSTTTIKPNKNRPIQRTQSQFSVSSSSQSSSNMLQPRTLHRIPALPNNIDVKEHLYYLLHAKRCIKMTNKKLKKSSDNRVYSDKTLKTVKKCNCNFSWCSAFRDVLNHINNHRCQSSYRDRCQKPHCDMSKWLIGHWEMCGDQGKMSGCAICPSVSRGLYAMEKRYKDTGRCC